MKTLTSMILGILVAVSVGYPLSGYAGINKHADNRARVEATNGMTAPSSAKLLRHLSRYARGQAEGTFIPTVQNKQLPKNFRNHY